MNSTQYFVDFKWFSMSALLIIFGMLPYSMALARDTVQYFSVAEALETSTAKELNSVAFYFGVQSYPKVKTRHGHYTTKRTTSAAFKPDEGACQWAFLSAIKTLHERALIEGGNAVVNITSVTTGDEVVSGDEYICRAGTWVAKVYLKGEVVTL